MTKHTFRGALLASLLLTGIGTAVQAQEGGERLTPPTPRRADANPPILWSYFVLIVVVGAVAGANLIPSKRGHQD